MMSEMKCDRCGSALQRVAEYTRFAGGFRAWLCLTCKNAWQVYCLEHDAYIEYYAAVNACNLLQAKAHWTEVALDNYQDAARLVAARSMIMFRASREWVQSGKEAIAEGAPPLPACEHPESEHTYLGTISKGRIIECLACHSLLYDKRWFIPRPASGKGDGEGQGT